MTDKDNNICTDKNCITHGDWYAKCNELEAAKQNVHDWRLLAHNLETEKEALENKLAERDDEADSLIGMQQIRIQELENSAAVHQANIELLATGVDDFWLAEHGDLFDDNGVFIGETEELTKLLAAARKEGFEEGCKFTVENECPSYYEAGKQAGRDELQREHEAAQLSFKRLGF